VVELSDINDARMGYEYCRLRRKHLDSEQLAGT
jgi:hypothetical protein